VWMGLYPSPFLRRLETSVNHIVLRVNPQYASACGGGAPSAVAAANPNDAARFLTALPCGPDGKPLPAPASPASSGAGADIPPPGAPR